LSIKHVIVPAVAVLSLFGLTACSEGNTISRDSFEQSVTKIDSQLETFVGELPQDDVLKVSHLGEANNKNGQPAGCENGGSSQVDSSIVYMPDNFDTKGYVEDLDGNVKGFNTSWNESGSDRSLIAQKDGYEYWFKAFTLEASTEPSAEATSDTTEGDAATESISPSDRGIQITAFGPCTTK
jgi:hypothetical protein